MENTKEKLVKYKIEDVPPTYCRRCLAWQHILAAFAGIIAVPLAASAA